MQLSKLIKEADGIPKYKVVIKYKEEEIELFLTKDELLNGILKFTNPQQTIDYIAKLVKARFKIKKINFREFFVNLKSLNIINEKTNSSFQLNRIQNLGSGDESDYQIIVGHKKGLTGNSLNDITDKTTSDKTRNGILDARLQGAINAFREIVKQDLE